MSRRTNRGKPKKKKAPKTKQSPNAMMAQMQQMQQEMGEAQKALEDEFVTITAGGGAISIVISGHQRVQSITLDPEIIDPEDVDMLQDMITAAVNQAIEQSQALAAERMEGITGGLGGGLGGGLQDMLGGMGLGL